MYCGGMESPSYHVGICEVDGGHPLANGGEAMPEDVFRIFAAGIRLK